MEDRVVPALNVASISGTFTGSLTEDSATSQTSGNLSVTDPDSGESAFQIPGNLAGTYGTFTFNEIKGAWTYTLDNNRAATNRQIEGKQVSDTLTVTSLDGSASQTIVVTITGANDAPVVGDASLAATEDGPAVTTGVLADDVDGDDDASTLSYVVSEPVTPSVVSVTASSTYLANVPQNAFDGDPTTAWNAGDYSGTITARFAAPVTFNGVLLFVGATPTTPEDYIVFGSTDGVNFVQLARSTQTVVSGSVYQLDPIIFPSSTYQYLRIQVAGNASWVSINEVQLLAVRPGSNGNGTFTFNPGNDFQDLAEGETRQVSLIVTATDRHGAIGEPGLITVTVTGVNDAPTAQAGETYTVSEGGTITLAGSGSDPDGDALTYAWDLDNDGTFETPGQNVTFSAVGRDGLSSQTVNLRVSDGMIAVAGTATVTIQNAPPTITNVSNSGPSNEGSPVTVTVSATDTAGVLDPLAYDFDFDNDGIFEVSNATGSAQHTFTENGTYQVNVRVRDGDGGEDTGSALVLVNNVAPTAELSHNGPVTYSAPVIVSLGNPFDPSATDTAAGFRYAYAIDNPSALAALTYADLEGSTASASFNLNAGTYTVYARIFDKDNGSSQHSSSVTVEKANQIITWDTPVSVLQGTPLSTDQLNATVCVVGPDPAGALIYSHIVGDILGVGEHTLSVTAAETQNYHAASVTVALEVLKPYILSGFAFADFNNDGEINFGEGGIGNVLVTLTGTDDLSNAVEQTDQTDVDGFYHFGDLRPGSYSLKQTQPTGYEQGINSVGTLGGTITGLDQFFIELSGDREVLLDLEGATAGLNYNFGERPPAGETVGASQTAGMGFWNDRHGQGLIRSLNGGAADTQLGNWLSSTFSNLFGALAGKSNAEVATYFQQLFAVRGQKLEAQVMATALAVYVTNETLAGTTAQAYGFTVTEYGVGTSTFNVGTNGAAFGQDNYTEITILDLLRATDSMSVNGILYGQDANLMTALRNMANTIYSAINEAGHR